MHASIQFQPSIQRASQPANHPAIHAIQCKCRLVHFHCIYISQSKANSVALHFISCHFSSYQFDSIKYLHPTPVTPAANWPSILHYTFQTLRASCDFLCLSWRRLSSTTSTCQRWSLGQTSPTDLCNKKQMNIRNIRVEQVFWIQLQNSRGT